MPPTLSRMAPNLDGPSLSVITIIAVHLLAIFANEVREGQVANMTFHTGVAFDIHLLSYVEVTGYLL